MSKVDLEVTITVADLEADVFKHEGVRLIIRTAPTTRIVCGYKKKYSRCLGDDRGTVLLVNRIKSIVGEDTFVEVIDGRGMIVSVNTALLGGVRESYNRK